HSSAPWRGAAKPRQRPQADPCNRPLASVEPGRGVSRAIHSGQTHHTLYRVLKGHGFSRVSMGLLPTQVDEDGCPASAPEGRRENSPGWSVAEPWEYSQNTRPRPGGALRNRGKGPKPIHAIALWFRSNR